MGENDIVPTNSSTEDKAKKSYDEVKAQRSSTKGNMTRIKNYVMANVSTISAVELECRLNIFEQYWKMWLSHQVQLEKLRPDDTNHQACRSEVEDLYCEMKILHNSNRHSISDGNASLALPTIFKPNIPQIKLPTFSGKYSDYPNFISIFHKLVGDNDSLSTTEKYNHLRHCLTGAALRTIDALGKSAENYTVAMSTLKKRYDNKCLIFEEHITEITDLPKVTKGSASQLRGLIDAVSSHLNAMKTIGSEADIMNSLIVHLVTSKLDIESKTKYEDSFDYNNLPKWDDMYALLSKRCQLLEVREGKINKSGGSSSTSTLHTGQQNQLKRKFDNKQYSLAATTGSCSFCSDSNHKIDKCSNFEKLQVLERFQRVKQLSLCINCLRPGHTVKQCKSSSCKVCSKKHHTLLHRFEINNTDSNQQSSSTTRQYSGYVGYTQPGSQSNNSFSLENNKTLQPSIVSGSENSHVLTVSKSDPTFSFVSSSIPSPSETCKNHIFLATAIIQIKDITGSYRLARALLDSGSQLNFITERLVHLLHLKRQPIHGEVTGIGQTTSFVNQETIIDIKSRLNSYTTKLKCWILPCITNNHPDRKINRNNIQIPQNIELADPTFFKPQKIDLLIGAEKFFELLSVGQIKLNSYGPFLQKTVFGWILSGRHQSSEISQNICTSAVSNNEGLNIELKLDELLEKFWEVENIETNHNKLNVEQQNCEKLFIKTIQHMPDDRLMVKLPFKRSPNELGSSYDKVKAQFFSLERRLARNPEVKQQYSNFLHEYLTLQHMEEINWKDVPTAHYFIPHQYVIRPESTSTKLRVVFNASCPTSANVCLNDVLSVGPTVQNDIFSILFKFRWFRYALTADVSKMYRQIWVYPEDCNFQLIIWRNSTIENLKIFRLKTLTYGTASAPYLATRCLNYLADIHSSTFSKTAEIIKSSIYVDDLIAGGDDLSEIRQIKNEISAIFSSAKLVLHKWYSNEKSLLQQIPPEDLEKPLRIHGLDMIRTLGMIWDPKSDEFRFNIENEAEIKSPKITKRSVLSDLAKLFDPLGLVNPIVVSSKLFMQELWLLKISWDESLPQSLHDRWASFKSNLQELNLIKIPRFVLSSCTITSTEIHGFRDSSIKAFGACIYVRSMNVNKEATINLLCAKSKVAPSKKTRTLPELELLGAELLAKLWNKMKHCHPKQVNKVYFWTDSTIVLGWISSHASKWQTFVANRVSRIQDLSSEVTWYHINSKSNPADIISRGCTPGELRKSIWFQGPEFLYKTAEFWPVQKFSFAVDELPNRRKINNKNPFISLVVANTSTLLDSIYRTSNFNRNRRIFAYVCRFINKLKRKHIINQSSQSSLKILTSDELNQGFFKIIYLIQRSEFESDIDHLTKNKAVHHSSNLKNLNPFIDEDNLLKVGGRLRNANLPYNTRCPILLPKNNIFINSFIYYLHFRHCHAGSQALISIISHQFWIIGAREYTRKIVRNCVHCFRYRPKLLKQIMGDWPADRVNCGNAFSVSGVDFCGPIYTSPTTRGHRTYKTYIAVFVCFISKGVHLEVVTDLSTDAFIAALKRFISRRMMCTKLYCDNATNFVVARRNLAELRRYFLIQSVQSQITNWCAERSIEFVHIPPRSPHFGGIWEAAVKSAKSLLYPTVQNVHLTYESLSTVCCQIEAVLNSRPITQFSTDPNDERALTPAHFWGQAPADIFVEPDLTNLNYLSKWQKISSVQQHFWKRWSNEYISSLQKRSKWNTQSPDLVIGKLVIIHEDNLQKWLLGRIIQVIKGNDNKIRVADIKTKCGILRRSIHKLAILPTDFN